MKNSFICPYCDSLVACNSSTYSTRYIDFSSSFQFQLPNQRIEDETISVQFYCCSSCGKTSIAIEGVGIEFRGIHMRIIPFGDAKEFPEYIPLAIRQDYKEAASIVKLSPKASATLARRCLQGMIRDFWGITAKTLNKEIDALKDKVPASQWNVLDGVRQIGNIGAHMEKDVNNIIDIAPEDAQKLIQLLELLLKQWYIDRHDQEQLYADILQTNQELQEKRHHS